MFYKKSCSYKFRNIHRNHLCWNLFLKNVAGLKACNLLKKIPQHRCFPLNIAKFLRLPILENICEGLLFYCFNGSLLHGPKGSRSSFDDSVRLQGSSHGSSFLFLSRYLSYGTESQSAFENLRLRSSTFDEFFRLLYFFIVF